MASGISAGKRRVFLLRHAESEKNIEDRHGGEGRPITQVGYRELEALYFHLQNVVQLNCAVIYCTPIKQAEMSADYLAEKLGVKCTRDARIQSLNLGVLGGLSRKEAVVAYPEAARNLELWRSGQLEIEKLNIPESEPFKDFWERGFAFLHEKVTDPNNTGDLVVIGTRSILILLLNILLKNTLLKNKPYTVFEFVSGSITTLVLLNGLDAQLVSHNIKPSL